MCDGRTGFPGPAKLTSSPRMPRSTLPPLHFSAVVVTGGSAGLGEAFIRLLGSVVPGVPVCNLSRSDPAEKNGRGFQRPPHHVACDLAQPADVARGAAAVLAWLDQAAPAGPWLLIHNAGLGAFGRFPDPNPARQLAVVDINVRAVVDLTARLLPALRARGGALLNVASVLAYLPVPYAATYGASKAFLLHWSLALREELRESGVRVVAVCPGTTATGFFAAAGLARRPRGAMGADEVARFALRALAADRAHAVPGVRNRLLAWAGSLLPRSITVRACARVFAGRAGNLPG